jgi:hypothetical protein
MFLYQIIVLSIDYLSFPYSVKLDISQHNRVLPAITLCAPNFVSIQNIKTYFNITDQFYEISKKESNISNNDFEFKFYLKYFKKLFNEFSANILKITISAKDLFNCSANLHNFENLERKQMSDCEQNTTVFESIYNNLGKCFTYFADNYSERKSIFLNNDYIEFKMKKIDLIDLYFNRSIKSFNSKYGVFIHNPKNTIFKQFNTVSPLGGTLNEMRFRKTQTTFLSWPHEHDCIQYSGIIFGTL